MTSNGDTTGPPKETNNIVDIAKKEIPKSQLRHRRTQEEENFMI